MNEKEKLKKLLVHWLEHNNEHAATYRVWAQKMAEEGDGELSRLLMKLGDEVSMLNAILEEAITKTGKS